MKTLKDILKTVEKPSRYIGGEYGAEKGGFDKLNFCICFPDVYEVGMSNLGIKIVAESLKTVDGVFVDRAFSPWKDFGTALKENGIFLYGLTSQRPVRPA